MILSNRTPYVGTSTATRLEWHPLKSVVPRSEYERFCFRCHGRYSVHVLGPLKFVQCIGFGVTLSATEGSLPLAHLRYLPHLLPYNAEYGAFVSGMRLAKSLMGERIHLNFLRADFSNAASTLCLPTSSRLGIVDVGGFCLPTYLR